MIDRIQLLQELKRIAWHEPDADQKEAIKEACAQLVTHQAVATTEPYTVVAVDGSQIYSNPHEGSVASLIHIGALTLSYQREKSSFTYDTESFITPEGDDREQLDARRGLYELKALRARAALVHDKPLLLLVDGSLRCVDEPLHDHMLVGYISASRCRDLIEHLALDLPDTYTDRDMLELVLAQGMYTQAYPFHEGSYLFLYYHAGDEIVRIEIPAFCASAVAMIMELVADQVCKGVGYPVALAYAHKIAVVSEADRAAFYGLLAQVVPIKHSRKLFRKKYVPY